MLCYYAGLRHTNELVKQHTRFVQLAGREQRAAVSATSRAGSDFLAQMEVAARCSLKLKMMLPFGYLAFRAW